MEDFVYVDYEYEEGSPEYADYYVDDDYGTMEADSWNANEPDMDSSQQMTVRELIEYCVIPTASDSYAHLLGVFTWPLLFLLSSRIIHLPSIIAHITSVVFGGVYIWLVFGGWKIGLLAGLCAKAWLSLVGAHILVGKHRGPICFFTGVVYLVACELWLIDPIVWHAIRGIQMVILMKFVSLSFDLDTQEVKSLPNAMEVAGYIMHPGTVIFGPWISFSSYRDALKPMLWSWKWVMNLILRLLASLIFLLISTCFINWLLVDYSNKFVLAYRDALSFRASHYFISYISEIASSASGNEVGSVSRFHLIELPRSLVDVVINWNIPMHKWLKTYVFKMAHRKWGSFPALLVTYGTSALFHGLNFQLAAVLLSLGFYTYIEHTLRTKLADFFSACISARRCPSECKHKRKGYSIFCILVNILFGLVTMFHLAYLGMMFDSSHMQEKGYSMTHTLNKWGELHYASHWIAFIFYIANAVL